LCIDKNGKEHTLQLLSKIGGLVILWPSTIMKLSTLTIGITDSNIIEFNAEKLDGIYSIFPEFEAFQRKNLERHVVSLHKES
jgi:hypothetical protein